MRLQISDILERLQEMHEEADCMMLEHDRDTEHAILYRIEEILTNLPEWGLLAPGDVIQPGDEYWQEFSNRFERVTVDRIGGELLRGHAPIRRRLREA